MKTQLPFLAITQHLIKEKPDLKTGKAYLLKYLTKTYPDYLLNDIKAHNFSVAQEEFENWIVDMLQMKPLPAEIQSIWFGLSEGELQALTLYLLKFI